MVTTKETNKQSEFVFADLWILYVLPYALFAAQIIRLNRFFFLEDYSGQD
jgi:hypothetical protein